MLQGMCRQVQVLLERHLVSPELKLWVVWLLGPVSGPLAKRWMLLTLSYFSNLFLLLSFPFFFLKRACAFSRPHPLVEEPQVSVRDLGRENNLESAWRLKAHLWPSLLHYTHHAQPYAIEQNQTTHSRPVPWAAQAFQKTPLSGHSLWATTAEFCELCQSKPKRTKKPPLSSVWSQCPLRTSGRMLKTALYLCQIRHVRHQILHLCNSYFNGIATVFVLHLLETPTHTFQSISSVSLKDY